jgi:hypothetical protein
MDLNGNSRKKWLRPVAKWKIIFKTEVKTAQIINIFVCLPFYSLFLLFTLWLEGKIMHAYLAATSSCAGIVSQGSGCSVRSLMFTFAYPSIHCSCYLLYDKTLNTWLPLVHARALSRKGVAAPSGQALLYGSFFISKGEEYFPGGQASFSPQKSQIRNH